MTVNVVEVIEVTKIVLKKYNVINKKNSPRLNKKNSCFIINHNRNAQYFLEICERDFEFHFQNKKPIMPEQVLGSKMSLESVHL